MHRHITCNNSTPIIERRRSWKRSSKPPACVTGPGLHHRKNHPYKNDNPALPTLQPWLNTTSPPAERFVFVRNPYYHRIDDAGRQLPYVDEVAIHITSSSLVAAKTAAGESDLQGRYLRLDNYTFLKAGEARQDFSVHLWRTGRGSQIAIYPNLNSSDAVWRKLVRDRRFPAGVVGRYQPLRNQSSHLFRLGGGIQ